MRGFTAELLTWHTAGKTYAIATVIGVSGSAPRPVGAAMAVDAEGAVIGGLSGGGVEAAVYELCCAALRTGQPMRETFGHSDSDAFGSTDGRLEVFVQRVDVANRAAIEAVLRANESVALIRDLNTGAAMALGSWWSVGSAFGERVVAEARVMLDAAVTGIRTVGRDDTDTTVFVESWVRARSPGSSCRTRPSSPGSELALSAGRPTMLGRPA
ncbi:XdhC family protein [Nocardia uniformis]|uniref:XdhC family protein n=1 Tax=Nocardia uniformis TaxID=53432 RepID=A0A849CGH3_9NOCA|nr:XdhC family protein [Nocardia uniformis]NNH75757.1 XdhC family protein [Nocardia uniformis]